MITPPLKYAGGSTYLLKEIYAALPSSDTYKHLVIGCAGGMSEFWKWPHQNKSVVVNDIDGLLVNFYRVLQDKRLFAQFYREVEAIPFSEPDWEVARNMMVIADELAAPSLIEGEASVMLAAVYFVYIRQSLMGMGKTFATTSKSRLRNNMNEQVSAWLGCIKGLPEVHNALKKCVLKSKDVLRLIKEEDSEHSLLYLDPPWYATKRSKNLYRFEMSVEDHEKLLSALIACKSQVVLLGLDNELYSDKLTSRSDWSKFTFQKKNAMSTADKKLNQERCIWAKYH